MGKTGCTNKSSALLVWSLFLVLKRSKRQNMVGIFSRFSVSKTGHRRPQSALVSVSFLSFLAKLFVIIVCYTCIRMVIFWFVVLIERSGQLGFWSLPVISPHVCVGMIKEAIFFCLSLILFIVSCKFLKGLVFFPFPFPFFISCVWVVGVSIFGIWFDLMVICLNLNGLFSLCSAQLPI